MASVMFIIRVPFEENIENSKTGPMEPNYANQADDTADDEEILTDLNLAEVLITHISDHTTNQ